MRNIFLFIKRVFVIIVLAILQLVLSGNSKHQENIPKRVFEERRWTGTLTLEEKLTGITGTSERHVTVTFNNALPTLHRDETGIDPNDPTAVDHFTDDKGTGSETYHGEMIIEGKKFGVTDASGSGQTQLNIVDINDEDYYIHAIGPSCTGTTTDLINGITESYGPYNSDIVASDRIGIRRDILSGTKTTTSDIGVGTVTSTITWHLVRSTNDIDDPCIACGSVIGIENQSLGQAIAITGTSFALHYRSDRMPGYHGALDIGTWTFNVHHSLLGQRLQLGDGNQRTLGDDHGAIQAVSNEIPGVVPSSGYLIASRDGVEVYAFDKTGKHLRTLDALTGTLIYEFHYDDSARLAAIVDVNDLATTIERNGNGLTAAIISPYGQRTDLVLDSKLKLTSIMNPSGEKNSFTYSASGLLIKMIDTRGFAHTYEYDAAGKLLKDLDPAGGFTNLSRSSTTNGHNITVSTALNRTTNYVVNQAGGIRKRHTIFPDGTRKNETRWPGGKSSLESGDGTFESLTEEPDPRWSGKLSATGLFTTKLPSGLVATQKVLQKVSLSNPANPLSVVSTKDMVVLNGLTSTSSYIASERTATITSPMGRTYSTILDRKGRIGQIRIGGLAPLMLNYDAQGRLIATEQGTAGSARSYRYSYNSEGYLSQEIDPLGHTINYAYDRAGRVVQLTAPDNRQFNIAYDAGDNITQIVPAGRPAHRFEFNAVNLTTRYIPPAAGAETTITSYEYNADQQLTHIHRPDGENIAISYEPAGCNCGKISSLTTASGKTRYTYQSTTGLLKEITTAGGVVISFEYDGPLVKTEAWRGPVTGKLSRTYNNFFEITSDQVTNGPAIRYRYNDDGLLAQAGDMALAYSPLNTLVTNTTLGGVSETLGYNVFGELTENVFTVKGRPLYAAQYTRDMLGRIISKIETIRGNTDTYTYDYDLSGRLVVAGRNGSTGAAYTYDNNDNRLSAGITKATHDEQDRLIQSGSDTYSYSANGTLLKKFSGGSGTAYKFDAPGNLLRVELANGNVIDYIVDGRNRRIGIRMNKVLMKGFLYDDGFRIVAEHDGTNKLISRFVYGSRDHVPDYLIKGGVAYRIIADQLGSARLVVNVVNGDIAQRLDYDEFGNILADSNPGFQPFGFAGGLYDGNTKLTQFGARPYDASTGRWIAKDPIGFNAGRTNLYVYAANDPVNRFDPSGMADLVLPGKRLNLKAAKKIPSEENVCVIVAHGNKKGLYEGYGKNQRRLSVEELLQRIIAIPRCKDAKEIKLLACRTAGEYAQALAEISRKKVWAPNVKIKPKSDGTIEFVEPGGKLVPHSGNGDVYLGPTPSVTPTLE